MTDAAPKGHVLEAWQRGFLHAQRLPEAYIDAAVQYFDPLAEQIALRSEVQPGCLLVGVNGSQGSGKSTLCEYLRESLTYTYGKRCISLSLDDFYRTAKEREQLARDVHPLLRTRGVPGTHDIDLLNDTLASLRAQDGSVLVPRFDKSNDDRFEQSHWTQIACPIDVVLLEGWCLGASAQSQSELVTPINALERNEDSDGTWRRYVNHRLETEFEALHAKVDFWVMLSAPGFECVLNWRSEQEAKLRAVMEESAPGGANSLMDEAQLLRFIAHYERLTKQCLKTLPSTVDTLFELDAERHIIAPRRRG